MEANNLSGGILPGMASRMLGLEMALQQQHHQHQQLQQHHHPHPQQQQQQHHQQQQQQQQQQHPQLVSFGAHAYDTQAQQSLKQSTYPYPNKPKQQQSPLSDEEEPGFTGDDGGGDEKTSVSPWHRMKWTDTMVRLLIMAVFYIGDDVSSEGNNDPSNTGKKKSGGLLQKKGKWKSVSRAMMEKGFSVSPQQCEDKFNDLNKRYKRVNDILGKGTACKVVENQNLLDSMDHIPPKMKKEVKKLLNSKHLYFKEMCAYHNSGGAGGSGGAHCLHSPDDGGANSRNRAETEGLKVLKGGGREVVDVDGEEDEDDDDDEDEVEEEEEIEAESGRNVHNDEGEEERGSSKKRQRQGMESSLSPSMKQFNCELVSVLQDGTKSPLEKRQWMMKQLMQLEEQRVSFQYETFALEKQRLKWVQFSGKKERDMERLKLHNERIRLENERMILLLRHKELELVDIHRQQQQQQHSSNKKSDPSSITG